MRIGWRCRSLLQVATALLVGHDASMNSVRLVAASLQSSVTAISRVPVIGAAFLMPGSEAVEFVLDLANVARSLVHPVGTVPVLPEEAEPDHSGLIMRVGFCRAQDTWVRGDGFIGAVAGNTALIERLSPRQRCALGFPHPGHPRITTSVLWQLASRYPGLDMTPYEAALELHGGHSPPDYADPPLPAVPVDFMSETERL